MDTTIESIRAREILNAVDNVNHDIAKELRGKDALNQVLRNELIENLWRH